MYLHEIIYAKEIRGISFNKQVVNINLNFANLKMKPNVKIKHLFTEKYSHVPFRMKLLSFCLGEK